MKLLLLCLGLTLVCTYSEGEMEVVKNFEPSKIIGKWFTILIATDQKERIEESGTLRIFLDHIDVLKNASLLFNFHRLDNGQCLEVSTACNKTDQDGIYTASYDGQNLVSIADVKYDEYLIILMKNENNFQVILLYGRQPDVRKKIKKKFMEFSDRHGIVEGNIIDMTKVEDPCLQA
ncbi:PREDICTED: allergen Fel d 4-like isoform X1 [Dipodomys ordii]|uniref:Allergen Fel d 4-like isoform X1 n=1 Tax=Dipodomys ordii TaxID=10020 RepID=A0A1S3FQE4_DIPOR|nr:PREDICTED: allergen Fel d 4-like isoform X1 [Dipodomys ordii]